MKLTPDQHREIVECLRGGHPLEAVRRLRAFTGCVAEHARTYIYDELRRLQPEPPAANAPGRQKIVRPPAEYDQRIISRITFLDDPALTALRDVQRQIAHLHAGDNYVANFDAKAVCFPDTTLPMREAIHLCYPEVELSHDEIVPSSMDALAATVNECLRFDGEGSSLSHPSRRRRLDAELIPAYWQCVRRIIRATAPTVYRCREAPFGYAVWWDFAFILYDPGEQRCLILAGVASD